MPKVSSITRVLEIIEAVSYASKPLSPLELSQELDINRNKPFIDQILNQSMNGRFRDIKLLR